MTAQTLTHDEFIALVREKVAEFGSQAELANRIGVSHAFMSVVLNGLKPPSPRFAAYFGYDVAKTAIYIPKPKGASA